MRLLLVLLLLATPALAEPWLRGLGVTIGHHATGSLNAITDVPGVLVGQTTLHRGDGELKPGQGPVRTGVTAVLGCADPWAWRLPAATFVLNGNGEMAGAIYIDDLGTLETPILLTNTLNVGKVADACIDWLIRDHPDIGITADVPIPAVAECDDSTLNDIQGRHVGREEVFAALDGAAAGPVQEGAVGGGTGMIAYGFKAGIGTASRVVPEGYTVGVLVQANQGDRSELLVDGVPVGREIPEGEIARLTQGSIIMVVATDAPLSCSQLRRLARHTALGLARTGAVSHNGSGDLAIAFSTANAVPRSHEEGELSARAVINSSLNPLYEAVVEATEEAILNALVAAPTVVGRDGHTARALPSDRLVEVLRRYNRLP